MMNEKKNSVLKRSEEISRNSSGKKTTGVRFTLPSVGEEGINYCLSGFEEVKKRPLRIPPRGFAYSNFKPGKTIPRLDLNDFRTLSNLGDNIFKGMDKDGGFGREYKEAMDILLKNNKIELKNKKTNSNKSRSGPSTAIGARRSSSPATTSFLGVRGNNRSALKNELLKVSEEIKGDLQADIGFGFTSKTTPKQKLTASLKGDKAEIKVNEVVSEKVDRSISVLQGRIQEQRRKFVEYQSGSLKTPPTSTYTPNVSRRKNFARKKKTEESAKLSEIARIFRESIQVGVRDPMDAIRLPERDNKSPTKTNTPTTKTPVNPKPIPKKAMSVEIATLNSTTNPISAGEVVDFRQL